MSEPSEPRPPEAAADVDVPNGQNQAADVLRNDSTVTRLREGC